MICEFGPFQVIPYLHDSLVSEFEIVNKTFSHCYLSERIKFKVKYPDNATEIEMEWLNKSYVDLTVSGNKLHFKVRKISFYISVCYFFTCFKTSTFNFLVD